MESLIHDEINEKNRNLDMDSGIIVWYTTMTIVTVDMDDTLISTAFDYDEASKEFGEYMEDGFGVDAQEAVKIQNEIDYELLQEEGLKLERYPMSFVRALEELVEAPSEEAIEDVRQIGFSTFKSADEYASRGFMDGAEAMLNCLRTVTDHLQLVTVGDPKVQHPKIDGLNLEHWFDEIHIPSYEQGKASVFENILDGKDGFESDHFVHVGNSASSDVEAALDAGGYAVYISDSLDWLSDDELHQKFVNHERVYAYTSAHEFVPDAPAVVANHSPRNGLSERII